MIKISIILFVILFASCNQHQEARFPVLRGQYLGQIPPGMKPVVFAPGIISTGLFTRDITINKDLSEIYFCISDAAATAILVTRLVDNKWTEPAIAPFSGKGFFDFEPHITPDGKKLLFLSNRPPNNMEQKNGWYYQNIWMMNTEDTLMSKPQLAFDSVTVKDNSYFPSVTKDDILYFTCSSITGKSRIFKSKFKNGKYRNPELVPFDIPENGILFNSYISPDEDFLITCAVNIDSTNTDQDYYISFRTKTGSWSRLIKFGPEINTPGDNANSAFVSPDGKYLFFSSSRRDVSLPEIQSGTSLRSIINFKISPGYGSSAIYWVDVKVIDELRPGY